MIDDWPKTTPPGHQERVEIASLTDSKYKKAHLPQTGGLERGGVSTEMALGIQWAD